jgi:hypothetical protein
MCSFHLQQDLAPFVPLRPNVFVDHCSHIEEKPHDYFTTVTMTVVKGDPIAINARTCHKGLRIDTLLPLPGFGLVPFVVELKIHPNSQIAPPTLNCFKCTSTREFTGYTFEVGLNTELLHSFCCKWKDLGTYNVLTQNCQHFVWFMLFAHGVDESSLVGICDLTPHVRVATRKAANECLAEYRRKKDASPR